MQCVGLNIRFVFKKLVMKKTLLFLALSLVMSGCSEGQPDVAAVGYVDNPVDGKFADGYIFLNGWAVDPDGLQSVEVVVNDQQVFLASTGIERADVVAARPDLSETARSGFQFEGDISNLLEGNDVVEVRTLDRQGNRTQLARLNVLAAPPSPWRELVQRYPQWKEDVFHLAVGTSGADDAQLKDFAAEYAAFQSDTIKFGVRVPVLYMRTTKGRAGDWVFDPDFDTSTEQDGKVIAEDSLRRVLDLSKQYQVPLLLTLNGGVWADARASAPDWDLNDYLEEDKVNVQWTAKGEAYPDDYLKNLPGSEESPELANSLTFNYYATTVHAYKKRNLQASAAVVAEFARENPHLFIGINLDPDVYINPFFSGEEWFDYNPGTLRQFREWLTASGPYAPGQPLAGLARSHLLTLDEVNELAGEHFKSWDEVVPPTPGRWFWRNPWFGVWEQFRRHLVHRHHDDMSQWVAEAGIDPSKIFTSQGFMAPQGKADPLPIFVESPVKNYDTAGVSIEGAKPSHGHLGAILYGRSARNDIAMENGRTLFGTIQDFDLDWGISEYSASDFLEPTRLAGYGDSYLSMLQVFNSNARFVSPMAWNGSNGIYEGQPGFTSFTSWRNTPAEVAFKDFALARAGLPRSAKLWPFGLRSAVGSEGWQLLADTQLKGERRALWVSPNEKGVATLLSPEIGLEGGRRHLLVMGFEQVASETSVEVIGTDADGKELQVLASATDIGTLSSGIAGVELELVLPEKAPKHLMIRFQSPSDVRLDHVLLAPL